MATGVTSVKYTTLNVQLLSMVFVVYDKSIGERLEQVSPLIVAEGGDDSDSASAMDVPTSDADKRKKRMSRY